MATVADNRPAEAVDVVARYTLAFALDRGDFPDLNDSDFKAIQVQAARYVACPSVDEYEAAYDYLTARADAAT